MNLLQAKVQTPRDQYCTSNITQFPLLKITEKGFAQRGEWRALLILLRGTKGYDLQKEREREREDFETGKSRQ